MKITLSIYFTGVLIGAHSLCAQDAPSRLGKDPTSDLMIEPTPLPKTSATPVRPRPKPKPTPTATPTPTASPTPVDQPTPAAPLPSASTPEQKIEPEREATPRAKKRVAKIKPTPSPHAEPPPTPRIESRSWRETRATAAKLRSLEKEWEASFNDPAVIEKSLAEDFVGTSPAGKLMTKKDLLREAKENPSPPPKTIAYDLDVNFHGPGIAVVTGASKQFNRNRAGQIVEHRYRFTDTWVERDGKWQCIASQSMLVPRD